MFEEFSLTLIRRVRYGIPEPLAAIAYGMAGRWRFPRFPQLGNRPRRESPFCWRNFDYRGLPCGFRKIFSFTPAKKTLVAT